MKLARSLFVLAAPLGLLACGSGDDVPLNTSGSTTETATATATATEESDTGAETGTTGTPDLPADACANVDCGNGLCAPDEDDVPVCTCEMGYINESEETSSACVLDETCVRIKTLDCKTSVEDGSAVGMLFNVTYCNGQPFTDLTPAEMALTESQGGAMGEPIDSAEALTSFVDVPFVHHVYVLVDVSESVKASGRLDALQAAITDFLTSVEGGGEPVRFALYLFDGHRELYPFVGDTADYASARTQIAGLANASGTDSASTNLIGGMIKGIAEIDQMQLSRKIASDEGFVSFNTMIVVSDGDDEAGLKTQAALEARYATTTTNIVTVGLGDETTFPELLELGRDGSFSAESDAEIGTIFTELAQRVNNTRANTYFLGYCSPKRGGSATVMAAVAEAVDNPLAGTASCEFDATFFADACGASVFNPVQACAAADCAGFVGCGTCAADNACLNGQCTQSRYLQNLSEGSSCVAHDQCSAVSFCDSSTNLCVAALATGVAGTNGGNCAPGCDPRASYCDATANTCLAVKSNGSACEASGECESKHCAADPDDPLNPTKICVEKSPLRESCSGEESCQQGSWCEGSGANMLCAERLYDYTVCGTTNAAACRTEICTNFPIAPGSSYCGPNDVALPFSAPLD